MEYRRGGGLCCAWMQIGQVSVTLTFGEERVDSCEGRRDVSAESLEALQIWRPLAARGDTIA